jgi:hypothetical protein
VLQRCMLAALFTWPEVKCSRGVQLVADELMPAAASKDYDLIALPVRVLGGGMAAPWLHNIALLQYTASSWRCCGTPIVALVGTLHRAACLALSGCVTALPLSSS